MKNLLIIVLCCMSCGIPREERKCDVVIDNACINMGEYEEVDIDDVQYAIDVAYFQYSWMYDVEFDFTRIAEIRDLYIKFTTFEEVEEYCGAGAGACYSYPQGEIRIAYVDTSRIIVLKRLAHELLHFWNRHYLKDKKPELFGESFNITEALHSAPNMFDEWKFNYGGDTSVETEAWIDIVNYVCWKYGCL